MSKIAASATLCEAEARWRNTEYLRHVPEHIKCQPWHRIVGTTRYVDDTLMLSCQLCHQCMAKLVPAIYQDVPFDVEPESRNLCWLDVAVNLDDQTIWQNYREVELQPRWSARLPYYISYTMGRVTRFEELGLVGPPLAQAICTLIRDMARAGISGRDAHGLSHVLTRKTDTVQGRTAKEAFKEYEQLRRSDRA